MRRRLSLGISLIGDPSIVFLDEPTTGLDPENKRPIWEILSSNLFIKTNLYNTKKIMPIQENILNQMISSSQ